MRFWRLLKNLETAIKIGNLKRVYERLKGKELGEAILLPSVMLKHDEAKFLDDLTVAEVAHQLETEIVPVNGVEEFIKNCVC